MGVELERGTAGGTAGARDRQSHGGVEPNGSEARHLGERLAGADGHSGAHVELLNCSADWAAHRHDVACPAGALDTRDEVFRHSEQPHSLF